MPGSRARCAARSSRESCSRRGAMRSRSRCRAKAARGAAYWALSRRSASREPSVKMHAMMIAAIHQFLDVCAAPRCCVRRPARLRRSGYARARGAARASLHRPRAGRVRNVPRMTLPSDSASVAQLLAGSDDAPGQPVVLADEVRDEGVLRVLIEFARAWRPAEYGRRRRRRRGPTSSALRPDRASHRRS